MFAEAGTTPEFNLFLRELKERDPLALAMIRVYIYTERGQFTLAVREGARVLPRVSGNPYLRWRLFIALGTAYRGMGKMNLGETYFQRALEMANLMGDREAISWTKFQIYTTRFFGAEYEQAHRGFVNYRRDPEAWKPHRADFFIGIYALLKGQPAEAIKTLDCFLEAEEKGPFWLGGLEAKALTLRIMGRFSDAMNAFLESTKGYIDYGAAYASLPIAKALELSRLAGLEPPPQKLIKKALSIGKRGSWGEQAAAQEIEALIVEDDAVAAEGIYEAARSYMRGCQNIEAFLSGLTAAFLGWRTESEVFPKALNLISPLIPLHLGFRNDPLLGDFLHGAELFLRETLGTPTEKRGIRAYLIGGLRVFIEEKEIRVEKWHNNKAIRAFLYLLLSSSHRMAHDHLFYLLWPRKSYNNKSRFLLYTAIDMIRRRLGKREFLTKKRDFYQLEDVWTDLGEIEDLIRRADATPDPAEKEELLSRARELAKGDLLPEFPYDRHVDEYRQYYKRLKERLFGNPSP